MSRVEFSEYRDEDRSGKVFVDPNEVAAVREWLYHSFRPSITEIVLTTGEKVRVWEPVEVVNRRLVCEEDRMNKRREEGEIICKEVTVDTEVAIGIEEIQSALSEAIAEARDNPRQFSIQQYVSAAWQAMNAMTDAQIALVGPANCQHVANTLHKLADRFAAQAVDPAQEG